MKMRKGRYGMIDVYLLGTGGMMPLPGRALTSLYIRHNGKVLLIDCGEGTQTEIRRASLRFKPIDAILITHFHADHISGLPGLLLTLGNEGRIDPLHMYGPAGLERVVNALRVIVGELPFGIVFHEMPIGENSRFFCSGLWVDAFPLDHGMPCFGYRFDLERPGLFDPVRAKQRGIPVHLWSRLQKGEHLDGFAPEDVLGQPRQGLRLLYATDSRPVPLMAELGQNADLLILEGMFGEPEKLERAIEAKHMLMMEAAEIAAEAKPKQLWLTHFSPANPEPEGFLEQVREIFPETIVGRDGMFVQLRFPE